MHTKRRKKYLFLTGTICKPAFVLVITVFFISSLAFYCSGCQLQQTSTPQKSTILVPDTSTSQTIVLTDPTNSQAAKKQSSSSTSQVSSRPTTPATGTTTSGTSQAESAKTDQTQASESALATSKEAAITPVISTATPTKTVKPTDKPAASTSQDKSTKAPATSSVPPLPSKIPTNPPTPTKAPTKAAEPTKAPTKAPTATPTATPAATAANFPATNYGTFFQDQYGKQSKLTKSDDGGVVVDTGSSANGVVLVRVDNIAKSKLVKAIVTANGSSYQYDIVDRGKYVGLPLQLGNGTYTVTIYEQVSGTSYIAVMAHSFAVSLASSLKPYTASSIISSFSRNSRCVAQATSLCKGINSQDGKVQAVYNWIAANITYDTALASNITKNKALYETYLPDPDKTISARKGICFDYASLMCAMLRSQGIPTRLVKGTTPLGYHAWNEVYFKGKGWVVIAGFRLKEIDGSSWVLLDTTWAAAGWDPEKIMKTSHKKQRVY